MVHLQMSLNFETLHKSSNQLILAPQRKIIAQLAYEKQYQSYLKN